MASKSRAAQEKLVQLEKSSAPFEDQLGEAARFIGVHVDSIGRQDLGKETLKKQSISYSFYGKEDWLLKWLLKKLQAPKDDIPRKSALSWKLFTHLIQTLPTSNTARILTERKFMPILRQTLEEVERLAQETMESHKKSALESSAEEDSHRQRSKKRKRSGELVAVESSKHQGIPELLAAIWAALETMITFTTLSPNYQEQELDSMFSVEYVKTVLRSTGEDSAKVLGLWLSLSYMFRDHENTRESSWFSPLIAIWELRYTGLEDSMHFSLHCSQFLLALLRHFRTQVNTPHECEPELAQLVARNIMIPAKAAKVDNADSDLLSTLTRLSIAQDSANAPLLFEIAVVSLQPLGAHRRRQEDDSWLQTVFSTLKESMPSQRVKENGEAIQCMLDIAITFNIKFELSILCAIVSEFAISTDTTNWKLVSTIIKLDANTLLIPNENEDLLEEVLNRITVACVEPTWAVRQRQMVTDVVVPLMGEFAKARDLSGFIRHWFAQVVAFEDLRKRATSTSISTFSVWEDDALQQELMKLLEPSLTVQQLVLLLEWLSGEAGKNSAAVCLILEAISGSIITEKFIDAIGLRLYHAMFDNIAPKNLDKRYKWRSWRLLSRTLSWIQPDHIDEVSQLWNQKHTPFDELTSNLGVAGLLQTVDDTGLEMLEICRFGCVAWRNTTEGSQLIALAEKLMVGLLQGLAKDLRSFLKRLANNEELGNEVCGFHQNTLNRGLGWMMWSFVQCVFVENSEVLKIGDRLPEGMFINILQTVLWIASTTLEAGGTELHPWLHLNLDALTSIWKSFLNSGLLQDDEHLKAIIVNVLLSSQFDTENPLTMTQANNIGAIMLLMSLPLDVFSKKERERIMKAWLPSSSPQHVQGLLHESTALYPQVLALKAKIMHRPSLYEGIRYKDLIILADSIADSKSAELEVNIGLLKEITKLTLQQVMENLDQSRNRIYALDLAQYVQKKIKTKTGEGDKTKHRWSAAKVALFEATLVSLAVRREALNDLGILSNSDLISLTHSFGDSLVDRLHKLLRRGQKTRGNEKQRLIVANIDALTAINVDKTKLASLVDEAKDFLSTINKTDHDTELRLATFFSGLPQEDGEIIDLKKKGDTSTMAGRRSILAIVQTGLLGKDQEDKLELLESIFRRPNATSIELDRLLATKHIISACADNRRTFDEEEAFDLSSAYSELCKKMWRADGYREFAVITETMEMMLRTKGRAISQWNIDSTLGGISIVCSRRGPSIRSSQAGKVYLHLCHLLQAILASHRLKLEGHFHLVVQSVTSLLRCLFAPLPSSNARSSKAFPPAPWLADSSLHINTRHAVAFTRILTLICNPSVSSVTRSQHNALTSSIDKAKRMAGQHMQYVLMAYIRLQLEMKMLPAVREQLIPGIYAIFDTTTPELRRAINEGMDGSGRAVFRNLYTDYTKFGKWNGS